MLWQPNESLVPRQERQFCSKHICILHKWEPQRQRDGEGSRWWSFRSHEMINGPSRVFKNRLKYDLKSNQIICRQYDLKSQSNRPFQSDLKSKSNQIVSHHGSFLCVLGQISTSFGMIKMLKTFSRNKIDFYRGFTCFSCCLKVFCC